MQELPTHFSHMRPGSVMCQKEPRAQCTSIWSHDGSEDLILVPLAITLFSLFLEQCILLSLFLTCFCERLQPMIVTTRMSSWSPSSSLLKIVHRSSLTRFLNSAVAVFAPPGKVNREDLSCNVLGRGKNVSPCFSTDCFLEQICFRFFRFTRRQLHFYFILK